MNISPLSNLTDCVFWACLLEATAAKPGNVHRGADFEDLTYPDLIMAGQAIAPVLAQSPSLPLGQAIHAAVAATRAAVNTNANLGIILLLAPLCLVPRHQSLAEGISAVLDNLSPQDATLTYAAINLARPGGMGQVTQADLQAAPPQDLLAAMRFAAQYDSIARQYATNFHDLWHLVVPSLRQNLQRLPTLAAIVKTFVEVLAALPDTLIQRKCGVATARHASDWAAEVLAAAKDSDESYQQALADWDFWLRSDGHRRNPGTTADLICAGLFVGLREGWLRPPFQWE
ncbi:MAG: triphosphoribosyl-dephospho-CoA synthase [Pirellulales bacterium]|nr:triphosphoribosyl-dephospho-CoA synthase [Pirellulales bacterium]